MNDDLVLMISRIIRAPRDLVWKAWSDPEQLVKWWCPRPWQTEVLAFDLRPGGAFDTVLHGPNGEENRIPGIFLDVISSERVVFSTVMTEGWQPVADPFLSFTAIITLEDEGKDTRYSARLIHGDAATRDRHEKMGFEEGWGAAIKQLEEVARELI